MKRKLFLKGLKNIQGLCFIVVQVWFSKAYSASKVESISMDFVTALPWVEGLIPLVVVDTLTKDVQFITMHFTNKALQLAESIVSDRDAKFISDFGKNLSKFVGTTLTTSTSSLPQTDGQAEIVNKCLEEYLRNDVVEQRASWPRWLHQ
jgi:hypothetical protein